MNVPNRSREAAQDAAATRVTATLRLLETTDLHANLLPYDYFAGKRAQPYGLARIATLTRAARAECDNVLLFDNGDALQGTPLADITAQEGSGWTGTHPVIKAMNLLGYDAATLGNHEFNFGLDWLLGALAGAEFPFTCANALKSCGAPLLSEYLLLDRQLRDDAGDLHPIHIGVVGLVPPQITSWDQLHLAGRLESRDMVDTARRVVPALRAAGADLVIVLAHTGIAQGPEHPMMENAALPLASIDGVDALMIGHTHGVFPGQEMGGRPAVDPEAGTLHGTPAVMAGFRGSHLGLIDLRLARVGGQWEVLGHRSEARPVVPGAGGRPARIDRPVADALAGAHRVTLGLTTRPIGRTGRPLHSYLAMVRCCPTVRLVTQAQREALRLALVGTEDAGLPVLSASAPFKTGGRGGPLHFTDIPAGPVSLRHAADLYPFPNTLCGLRITGADLRDWLERAAICFNRIVPGQDGQTLCNPAMPGHMFDMIDGLTYRIDLTQPPRHAANGAVVNPRARRILDLCHAGVPLRDTDRFILATNSYRAFGGGPFRPQPRSALAHVGEVPVRDLLARHLASGAADEAAPPSVWQFVPVPGTRVLVDTGPGLRAHAADLARTGAEDLGLTETGFLRLRLPL